MMWAGDCARIRPALGVYMLGAIEVNERALVDDHLAGCLDCRNELADLAELPPLLGKIPRFEAERLLASDLAADSAVPSAHMLPALLDRVAVVRRAHRRRVFAAAAAVAMLALGGGVGVAHLISPAATSRQVAGSAGLAADWHTVSVADAQTGAHLTVRYSRVSWGTQLSVRVTGIKPGVVCQFEAIDSSGRHWMVGGWRYTYSTAPVWYPISTSLSPSSLRGFELVSHGQALAQVSTVS